MENGKKIIAALVIGVLLIVWGLFVLSGKKAAKYGYELTQEKSTMTGTTHTWETTTQSGVIANPASTETLAYINSWNGDVKVEEKWTSAAVTPSMSFSEGDTLTTGTDGSAEIIFSDNSVVRMNSSSRLSFVKLASDGSEVRLDEGDIWARVLKPFYDSSFFTISTSDVSAWVQGTSVRMKKTLTGATNVAVIDSYAQNKDKEWVLLTYVNPKRKVRSEQRLKAENQFTYTDSGSVAVITSFSGAVALKDTFIRENTKRDLVYIDDLTKKKSKDENLMKRLQWELAVSMPKKDEIPVFFDEPSIGQVVLKSTEKNPALLTISGWVWLSSDTAIGWTLMMDNIKKDLAITDDRREVQKIQHQIQETTVTPEDKKKLEETLHQKEVKIDTTIQEVQKETKAMELPIVPTVGATGSIEWTGTSPVTTKEKPPVVSPVKKLPILTPVKLTPLPVVTPIKETTPVSTVPTVQKIIPIVKPRTTVSGEVIIK